MEHGDAFSWPPAENIGFTRIGPMCVYAVTNFMPVSCAMELRWNRGLLADVHATELLEMMKEGSWSFLLEVLSEKCFLAPCSSPFCVICAQLLI